MLPSRSFDSTSDRAKKNGYYSFGDEGLTATVGASGQLLRISRHFPGKRAGFCVDEPDMEEPFRVTPRLKQFLYRAEDPSFEKGIGTYVDALHLNRQVYYSELIHDRWPAFKIGSLDVNLDLQYAILDGTVYQTFKFDYSQITRNGSKPPSPPIIRLRGDSLIRNLDYITLPGQNPFNNTDDSGYKPARLEGGSIFREHEDEDGKQSFLSIMAFNDEHVFEIVEAPTLQIGEMPADYLLGWDYLLKWDEQASKDIDQYGRLSVTMAYRLGYDQSPVRPVDTVQSAEQLDLSTMPYEAQIFSNNPNLDVCLRKNLEHVLSVCSIPVVSTRGDEVPTIALTCGDVDSHFVSTAASFYCFQILLLALKHFQSRYESLTAYENDPNYQPTTNGTKTYVYGMMSRIKRVCKGHMRWLFKTSNTSGKLFCPYYWVNGDEIEEWQLGDLLSRKSLVETPFQVLKVCDFYELSSDNFNGDDMQALERIVRTWIQEIYNHKVNIPGLYAFPRYDTEPTRTFYLTDHAVIWQAIKSAEDIGIQLPASPECSSKHIQESILEMELQDEWLYNPPTFFISAAAIQKAQQKLGNLMAIPVDLIYLTFTGAVVDIPKSRPVKTKMSKNKIPMRVLQNATEIQNVVDAGRTAEDAKKRFWAFFASTPSENEVCMATIPVVSREDREEQEMRSFFQRHNSYDNFFAEDTAALLNTWTTELHLSFYTLLHDDRPGAPPSDDTLEAETFHFTTLSGVEAPRYLRKFAAGFRLKGDFFDRYWTCNFLEANPSRADDYPWKEGVQEEVQREVQALLERQFEGGRITEVEKNSWQQRRILELILFERIMQMMNESTRGILEWATSVLMGTRKRLQKTLSPTKGTKATRPHYKDLLDTIKEFREFQKAIRRMGRHYAEALANIDRWCDREKGRELERPRWTFNDESRYRVIILKLLASNDDSIQTLRRNQDKITNLIEMELDLMRGDLEFMRSELNQTQDENIKLFTVITTIFVPLGFAASIFSMDQAPETTTLYYMLATAAGAFVFTGAMLWVIKEVDLRKPYGEFKGLFRRNRTTIENEDTDSDEEEEDEADVGSSQYNTQSTNSMSVLPDLESPGRRSWSIRTYNKERGRKHNDLEATIGVHDAKHIS
ncbi:hypothetical protein CGCF415_v007595 [Colletotrichum fructicola]|nr:hypothetical protein CGCF415_v007595 [Colletotrichum fructicola]